MYYHFKYVYNYFWRISLIRDFDVSRFCLSSWLDLNCCITEIKKKKNQSVPHNRNGISDNPTASFKGDDEGHITIDYWKTVQ